jgi:hypothetical protein
VIQDQQGLRKKPIVLSDDNENEWCFDGVNIDASTKICTIEDQDYIYTGSFIYSRDDLNEIIFKNTQITCSTSMQTACAISIELSKTD